MKKIHSWILFFLLLLICHLKAISQCTSSGSKNGSLFTNISGTGTWVTPSNMATSNTIASSYSTTVPSGNTVFSNYIHVQNFGFSIPSNAIICGIAIKIERRQQGADNVSMFVTDNDVRLLKNSSPVGTNHAFPWNWSSTYSNTVHGGVADNWGAALTAADINSPNFGVAIKVKLQSNCCTQTLSADIDHVSATVFYTIPLPIELTNFDVSSPDKRTVKIDWTTSSENNNSGFAVERSVDAINWEEIEFVEGQENSNTLNNYSVTDDQPYSGISYYRLKQVDLNGEVEYFDPKMIEISKEIRIKADNGSIKISGLDDDQANITILDFAGRPIEHHILEKDSERMLIETSNIDHGLYIVIVETSTQKMVQKFYL